jgi:ADP-heptose:LPS heptosyltransferase
VEGLADRFEPALCDAYARLFSQAIAATVEGVDPASLIARYERVRRTRGISGKPRRVFVLSRVTLGADVAVTSVLLATAKRRFPRAKIMFVGPAKNHELFAHDRRIHHVPVTYQRGGLRQRLAIWDELTRLLSEPDAVVIDPDSRLTQLGLLPVCPEDRYHLFESRAYGSDSGRSLVELTAAWAEETFGIPGEKPYLALPAHSRVGRTGIRPATAGPYIAVSLGVGENAAKRLPDPFEEGLLALLARSGMPLWIDRGAGGEEAHRVVRAVERSGAAATFWDGSFAGFAGIISSACLYVGYDSAGQHVANAGGIPLISIFAGFPAPRMFERWRPTGPKSHVIRVDRLDPQSSLARVSEALAFLQIP